MKNQGKHFVPIRTLLVLLGLALVACASQQSDQDFIGAGAGPGEGSLAGSPGAAVTTPGLTPSAGDATQGSDTVGAPGASVGVPDGAGAPGGAAPGDDESGASNPSDGVGVSDPGQGNSQGGTTDVPPDDTWYNYEDNVAASPAPPGGLSPAQVPMFVAFGFDDNAYSGLEGSGGTGGMQWALEMAASRRNPAGAGNARTHDGEPVRFSFYYTSTYIGSWISESPVYVKKIWREAYEAGHEVGNHTFDHEHGASFTKDLWLEQMQACNDSLTLPFDPAEVSFEPQDSAGIGVPLEQIYGFRTPFLEYNDSTLQAAREMGLWYDCSIEEGWHWEQNGTNFNWPYTLDSGSPGHEILVDWGSKEAITSHPGLWELPTYVLIAPPDELAASYGIQPGLRAKLKGIASWFDEAGGKITGFDYNLWVSFQMTKAEYLATLKHSLDLRLQGNRAPFMLGAHTDYYSSKYTAPPASTARERQEAMEEFLDYALSRPEVRVVPIKDILDWVRAPVAL